MRARNASSRWIAAVAAAIVLAGPFSSDPATAQPGAMKLRPTTPPKSQPADGQAPPSRVIGRFGETRLYCGPMVKSLVFSPDGKILASCGGRPDGVALWDVATGQCLRTMDVGKRGGNSVAFSPDGKTVAAAGSDSSICFWDVATGAPGRSHSTGSSTGSRLAFGAGGNILAVNAGTKLRIIDVRTGRPLHDLPIRTMYFAFSPDGELLGISGISGKKYGVELWDPTAGKLVRRMDSGSTRFTGPAFSGDGRLVAAGCTYGACTGGVTVWRTETGKEAANLAGGGGRVSAIAMSPDGALVAGAAYGDGIRIWDVAKGTHLRNLSLSSGQACAVAFSPDGKLLAGVGAAGHIHIWDVATWRERFSEMGHRGPITAVASTADAARVVTGGADGTVRVWDGKTRKQLHRLDGGEKGILSLAVSHDDRIVAIGSADANVRFWDVVSGKPGRAIQTGFSALSLAFALDGRKLVALSREGVAAEIDANSGAVRSILKGSQQGLVRAALSPDARMAAAASRNVVWAWQLPSGKRVGLFGFSSSTSYAGIPLALDATGRLLATDTGRSVSVIEMDSGKVVRQFATDPRRAGKGMLAFRPDGRALAVTEPDGSVTFWGVSDGRDLAKCMGHQGPVSAVAFLPDGKRMLTGGSDGTAALWDIADVADPPAAEAAKPAAKPDSKAVERAWSELASNDAVKAHEAMEYLVSVGEPGTALLAGRLAPVQGLSAEHMSRQIDLLGHEQFAVREQATQELARLGSLAEPALSQALLASDNAEILARAQQLLAVLQDPRLRDGSLLQELRAVHVLERIASPRARALLEQLTGGSPLANVTIRAAAALERLKHARQ